MPRSRIALMRPMVLATSLIYVAVIFFAMAYFLYIPPYLEQLIWSLGGALITSSIVILVLRRDNQRTDAVLDLARQGVESLRLMSSRDGTSDVEQSFRDAIRSAAVVRVVVPFHAIGWLGLLNIRDTKPKGQDFAALLPDPESVIPRQSESVRALLHIVNAPPEGGDKALVRLTRQASDEVILITESSVYVLSPIAQFTDLSTFI